MGPRDKAVPPTGQQIGHFLRSEWSIDTVIFYIFYFFLIHRRAVITLDQSEAVFAELGEYSQNMLSEAFWTPNIASSQFDEKPEIGSRSKVSK